MALSTARFHAENRGVEEMLKQATIRRLLTSELCEIFANYERLGLFISEPGQRPRNGLLFVIKKDKLIEFKKDGYNWAKRKDGRTVMEGHEKLKFQDNILDCYYATGEENKNFKRRIYYKTIGEGPSDIAPFHYREEKGKRKKTEETIQHFREEVEKALPNLDSPGSSIGLPSLSLQKTCVPLVDPGDNFGDNTSEGLCRRFEKLLSLRSVHPSCPHSYISKIDGLKKLKSLEKRPAKEEISLEEKFISWFWQKVAEGGSGLTLVDEGGLGAIHFAAALGYYSAIDATIVAAEIDLNLSDKNGWTPLHWAAYFGRKHTVEFLISKGAAPGVLSIPTPNYLGGKRPADLALAAGHKDIVDYLEKQEELWLASLTGTY